MLKNLFKNKGFKSEADYWDERYRRGGSSGPGSYGRLAEYKAETLNRFVNENCIATVIEFGCGDGNQLAMANYPSYEGYDVSEVAVDTCRSRFQGSSTKTFGLLENYPGTKADLVLSLDVVFHLVNDETYEAYMRRLFNASEKFVVIYSSNYNLGYVSGSHIRHRKFTDWIRENISDFDLETMIENQYPYDEKKPKETSFCDFFIYRKKK